MSTIFSDFDLTDFWCKGEYPESLIEESPSDAMIAALEEELRYQLPAAYVALSRIQNGGLPKNRFHETPCTTSYGAEDHIEIAEIYSIGRLPQWSLGAPGCNTAFWVNECAYPSIGIYFANCPDHGHQMLALDYRECGSDGEPSVALVDEIEGYKIVPLATNFESFIRGLKPEGHFATDV